MDKKIQGKKNRAKGMRFELQVRKDLESKGWIVDKWSNNVEFPSEPKENEIDMTDYGGSDTIGMTVLEGKSIPAKNPNKILGKLIPAKRKYNPFNKALSIGTGFPDFIIFPDIKKYNQIGFKFGIGMDNYELCDGDYKLIIGIEVKSNGYLDKTEKEKCKWLLENNIFSKILIAKKGKKRGEIVYKEFENE